MYHYFTVVPQQALTSNVTNTFGIATTQRKKKQGEIRKYPVVCAILFMGLAPDSDLHCSLVLFGLID